MRLAIVTPIVSPHQLPLACSLAARLGQDRFRYVATEDVGAERRDLGWDDDAGHPWIVRPAAAGAGVPDEARRWLVGADVVLCGTRDLALFRARLAAGRPTLYGSERWFKPPAGRLRLGWPPFLRMAVQLRALGRSALLHYLAIGGWAAGDMRDMGGFDDRIWQWGYFVSPSSPPPPPRPRPGGAPLRILWAGRMLGWKRVDTLIEAAARLRRAGRAVAVTILGRGPMELALRRAAARIELDGAVEFLPAVPIADMRERMRAADVYVLASSGGEGWGTVVNEAMLEGCAVVATDEAGAARTLVQDGVQGLLFRAGRANELATCLARLEDDDALRLRLAAAGQQRMLAEWTPDVAADRLLAMAEALTAGRAFAGFPHGPLMAVRAADDEAGGGET
jgi:glycosyltransferase involved in cell wall biosynthesis